MPDNLSSGLAGTDTADAMATPRPRARRGREITTPDGVVLTVNLADRGERTMALLIDLFFMGLAIAIASVGFGLLAAALLGLQWSMSLVVLCSFAIRSFYFIAFELRWQGQTPGKRAMKIRVIDRSGGRLSADAVFARNLMRELELFLPISLMVSNQVSTSGWGNLLTFLWVGVFVLLPFFNRDRMRAGDMIGGTWVVAAPASILLSDLASARSTDDDEPYRFTRDQLHVYGIYELQTLESVLRERGINARATFDTVYERISNKIGWAPEPGQTVHSRAFLEAYYRALRAHLETGLLFGKRRESKHDRSESRALSGTEV